MINTRGIPRYIQARERLTDQIKSGELQSGEKLPPEKILAEQFGVSRMTIRKSLDELVDAGLIYRRHGIGTFVSQSTFERDHTHLTDFFSTCILEGRKPESKLITKELSLANEKCAKALNINIAEQVIRLTTLRSVDAVPITYHDAYIPAKLFPSLVSAPIESIDLKNQHVWQMIEKMGFTMANVVERVEAQIAHEWLVEYLKVSIGSPILYGERVLYSDEGTPLKYAECFNRGDMYSLSVVLVR
ncbi:GntR family transcriptional regulator [Desulforhopalus sp. 52FAK]